MESLRDAKANIAAANKNVIKFLNSFIDDKSFVETDAFMSSETDLGDALGEGVVSGFARVGDTNVCVFAVNSAVLKGSIGALNAKKIVRAINNAVRMDKPIIAVWDTSGARFSEGIECLEGYGSILRAYTVAYGEVPIISIIKGNNFGISSYIAGISDFVIGYSGSVVATSSPLVLGSDSKAIATSCVKSGLITNVVDSDKALKETVCKMLGVFSGGATSGDDLNRVCKNLKRGVKADDVIKEVFDKNSFLPVRAEYADSVTTGFATLGDIPVGVVATCGGRLTADACTKISEFLNVCENAETPVVFLVDSVGTERGSDDAKLIREMSNLIYQVNTLDVDIFSVVTGQAIGGAYTALVSPAEYKIAWDSAEAGALESEAAARLLFADDIKSAKNKDKAAEKLAKSYSEENMSALTIAKGGHFDNVIDPNATRSYLLAALLAHIE
ncbi:MAG: hypothetical protein J1G04_03990 [Clostridiales bacterium]|nr:hypothetical protein [Clostridiales bacterium]